MYNLVYIITFEMKIQSFFNKYKEIRVIQNF